ncbi:hypothetical protein LTS07_010324 [Exophiala sideris]|nr:hypothetical protein LTS07_010324 [Exophiala sideris]
MPKVHAGGDFLCPAYMLGKIALEEAMHMPETVDFCRNQAILGRGDAFAEQMLDIHGERLEIMTKHNVEFFVLSLASPGPQGRCNKEDAEGLASRANDYMAKEVAKNPKHFAGFASLSMHDPVQAAGELRRAVQELGLKGAILNDYQSAGPSGEQMLMYDQPKYDPFWSAVQDMDVPVYIHPRIPARLVDTWKVPHVKTDLWDEREWLMVAALQFGQDVQRHILGMCVNGVFDRFPSLKIIIGHLGEMIPAHLWRVDHWMIRHHKHRGLPMKNPIRYYFQKNIWLTTSGHFSTPDLMNAVTAVGADHIMFSIDHPFEDIEEAAMWWDTLQINPVDKVNMGRNNAIKLLKLDLPLMGVEAVMDGLSRQL